MAEVKLTKAQRMYEAVMPDGDTVDPLSLIAVMGDEVWVWNGIHPYPIDIGGGVTITIRPLAGRSALGDER